VHPARELERQPKQVPGAQQLVGESAGVITDILEYIEILEPVDLV
jgi:hypothetical protein